MGMRIKYSPCKHDRDTLIEAVDGNTLRIDGELYEFDPGDVAWPAIVQDTEGLILEAHREAGILYATVRRFYTSGCGSWDDGLYSEVKP
jgi:hypothetical protein